MAKSRIVWDALDEIVTEEDKAMSTLGTQSAFLSMLNIGTFSTSSSVLLAVRTWLTSGMQFPSWALICLISMMKTTIAAAMRTNCTDPQAQQPTLSSSLTR